MDDRDSRRPELARLPRRERVQRQPQPVPSSPGLVTVDATWGRIQPIALPGGVHTVGELEVIEHLRGGGLLVDTRHEADTRLGVIPGAVPIPHEQILARLESQQGRPTFLYCNGPQCTATPLAVAALLAAGTPPELLRYYRGGIHDWVTLGLPLERPDLTR